MDYDPVILEDAGNPLSDPDFIYTTAVIQDDDEDESEIYYQTSEPEPAFDVKKAREALKHPLVKDTIIPQGVSAKDLTNAKLWAAVAGSATALSVT